MDAELAVLTDPEELARRKAARRLRFHTVRVPRLRFAGGLVFIAFAWLHYLAILPDPALVGPLRAVTVASVLYIFGTWIVLAKLYERTRWIDLGDVFMTTDVLVYAALIWATGGERSLLFFLMMVRPADQSPTGTRRTLFFTAVSAVVYLGLIVILDLLPGHDVSWPAELVKLAFITGFNLNMAGIASVARRIRAQTSAAMRLAQSLIVDLKAKSEELEAARVRAEEANLAKSQFLANMSHEIRTPMSGIIGVNDLLRKTELPPDASSYARVIGDSADGLLRLIDDILDLSKVEAGKLELQESAFSLQEVLDHVVRLAGPLAEEKEIGLTIESEEQLPDLLFGDSSRLQQVLLNLVGNAIKFTHEGGVTLAVAAGDAAQIRFVVRDTGIGIEPEVRRRIFEPFTQADPSASRQFAGSGLGLAISRRLVELMSGTIEVDSTPGLGSTFTVELPVPVATEDKRHATGPLDLALAVDPAKFRILVADDNEVNRLVAQRMLEGMGYSADAVSDGETALEALGRAQYDLLLLDCQMPGIDGYETARRIRAGETGGRIPIVAVTAHAMRGDRERCIAAGMDDYLAKPFKALDLAIVLQRWLQAASRSGPAA